MNLLDNSETTHRLKRYIDGFTLGGRAPVPTGYEAGLASVPVWMTWRKENYLPHRDSNSDPSVVEPVAQSLYRLSYTGSLRRKDIILSLYQ
jgi:hypothetical protein